MAAGCNSIKERTMKKIFGILLILSMGLLTASCGEKQKGPDVATKIVAEWHLTSVSGMDNSAVPEVYISFAQDFSFELYQKIGAGRFRKYEGTYAVAGSVVSGSYNDGETWGSTYKASFEGEELVLTAENGSAEVCRYEKKALSQSDKADAIVVTRSAEADGLRFL
jgi:hypothetical protein